MTGKKKIIVSIMVLALAALACSVPGMNQDDANLLGTQLSGTLAALELTQNALTVVPIDAGTVVDPIADVPTSTSTPLVTETPSATTTPTKPVLSVNTNTNCRSGPGLKYPINGTIAVGGSYEVVAKAPSPEPYVIIKNPGGGADCWAWLEYATITGDINNLATVAVPPPPLGSISGFVWIEDCDDTNPGNSCVNNTGSGFFEGDGKFNNEFLLQGVVAELFSGKCSSTTSLATSTTNGNGTYLFDKLVAGTYCVVIDTFKHGNDSVLLNTTFGGTFTFPNRNAAVQSFQVDLLPGKAVNGFNFGWDDFEQ